MLPHLVGQQLAGFPESVASRSAAQLAQLADDYYRSLAQSFPNATWITDKRPDNFLYIGLIKQLFPGARIVHTTRDPLDNCLSIFFLHLDPAAIVRVGSERYRASLPAICPSHAPLEVPLRR